MQDWSMVPVHIRCTERKRIDPNYPDDDAKFWRLTEENSRRMGSNRIFSNYGKVPKVVLEYARELQKRGDRLAMQNLAGACRVSLETVQKALAEDQRRTPAGRQRKYEEMSSGEIARDRWLQEN